MPLQSPGGMSVPTIYPSGSTSQQVVPVAVHPSGAAEHYVNVRLTNGDSYYTAGGVSVSGGSVLTADQGSPNTLGNAWPVKLTDGSSIFGARTSPIHSLITSGGVGVGVSQVSATGALRVDVVQTVATPVTDNNSTLSVDDGAGSLTVDGTVTAAQGTAAGLGAPWTVMLVSGSDTLGTPTKALHTTGSVAVLVGGAAISNSNPVPISDAGGSLTVDGTVTIQDGGNVITVDGTVTSTQGTPAAISAPWPVILSSGSDTIGTPTKPLHATGSVSVLVGGAAIANSNPVPISDAGGSLTVDGTTTANQGTAAGLSGPWTVMLVSGSDTLGHPAKGVHTTAADRTGMMYQDNTQRAVTYAQLAPSGSGNSAVVAAQGASNKIRVLSVHVMVSGSVSVKFQSATTDITGLYPCRDGGGFVLPYNPHGWFQTAANEALNINLSSANPTGVTITYIVVA